MWITLWAWHHFSVGSGITKGFNVLKHHTVNMIDQQQHSAKRSGVGTLNVFILPDSFNVLSNYTFGWLPAIRSTNNCNIDYKVSCPPITSKRRRSGIITIQCRELVIDWTAAFLVMASKGFSVKLRAEETR